MRHNYRTTLALNGVTYSIFILFTVYMKMSDTIAEGMLSMQI